MNFSIMLDEKLIGLRRFRQVFDEAQGVT